MCWFLQYFLHVCGIFFSLENLLYLWTFLLIHFLGAEIVGKVNERILFFLDISLCMKFFFQKSSHVQVYELFLIFTWTTSKHCSLSNGSSLIQRISRLLLFCYCILTLYSITSVCIFSILLSRHFLRLWQGEFVQQSRASLVGDHFLYSHDLDVWFRADVVWRNWMFVTLRS